MPESKSPPAAASGRRSRRGLDPRAFRFVILIGIMSLFADVVYEGAHSVNGQFLFALGASATAVGAVAGLGEFAAYGLRIFSGKWVDRTGWYWSTTIFGYFVNLLAVPALALANHWLLAASLMVVERAGKAIRNPPRDAMLSHAAHRVGPGWAFGIHEALDETGAALGPLVVALVLFLHGGFHLAYALLLVPAIVSLSLLIFARRTNPNPRDLEPAALHVAPRAFGPPFWFFAVGAALVGAGVADFSLMAYHLERHEILAAPLIPLLYATANGLNAGAALGAGRAFDRIGPRILGFGMLVPIASAPLVFFGGANAAIVGVLLWALGVTVQQTLFKAMVTRLTHGSRRALAFGTFDGLWGVAALMGSLGLGALYDLEVAWLVVASMALQVLAVPFVWVVAAPWTRGGRATESG